MAPVIHFVRHAQGFHNLPGASHDMLDPLLTPLGEEQCARLREGFPNHHRISLIVASPLRRTISTAFLSFGPALANGHCQPKILALPELQETSDSLCDCGKDPDTLAKELHDLQLPVDLSLVKPGWNIKLPTNKWSPSAAALNDRAIEAREILRSKIKELEAAGETDPEIVVVSHGGILHYLTEDWEDSKIYNRAPHKVDKLAWAVPSTAWTNTEYRSYDFIQWTPTPPHSPAPPSHLSYSGTLVPIDDYENATLHELASSRSRRGKPLHQPSRAVQIAHFSNAMTRSHPVDPVKLTAKIAAAELHSSVSSAASSPLSSELNSESASDAED